MLTQWQPLDDPQAFVSDFRGWRKALKMAEPEESAPVQQIQVYGSSTIISTAAV